MTTTAHWKTYKRLLQELEAFVEEGKQRRRLFSKPAVSAYQQQLLRLPAKFIELLKSCIRDEHDLAAFNVWWDAKAQVELAGLTQGERDDPSHVKNFGGKKSLFSVLSHMIEMCRDDECSEAFAGCFKSFFSSNELASHVAMTSRAERIYGMSSSDLRNRYL
ncbi:hypothetical protein JCM11491_006948 [Sporobolomyces phaffii]